MEDKNQSSNPDKAYRDELNEKGSTFTDSNAESAARDEAKMHKAATGQSQKIRRRKSACGRRHGKR